MGVLAIALLAAMSIPAYAAETVITGGPLLAGPRLADGLVVRLTEAPALRVDRFEANGAALSPAGLLPPGRDVQGWSASSSVAIVDRAHFTPFGKDGSRRDYERLDALGAHGFASLLECGSGSDENALGYATDGDRVAYVATKCSPYQSGAVVVRDLQTGAETDVPVRGGIIALALAGDYLAMLGSAYDQQSAAFHEGRSGDFIAVYNWRAGSLLHYYAQFDAGHRPLTITGFDIQADGKVALTRVSAVGCTAVYWFQTGDPTEHRVPVCTAPTILGSGIRIAADKIAVAAHADEAQAGPPWELVVSDLDGNVTRVATGFQEDPSAFRGDTGSGYDFDGTRIAFAEGSCDESRDEIHVVGLDSPPVTAKPTYCAVTIPRRSIRVSRGGKVSFAVTCPAGCRPDFAALIRRGAYIATRSFDQTLAPGVATRLSVTLRPRRLRRLKRDGTLRLDLSLWVYTTTERLTPPTLLRGVVLRWPRETH